MPVEFHVWGSSVLNNIGPRIYRDFKAAGILYKGPYEGGLGGIEDFADYDAMLITSENEGIPLALIQSQLAGVPVVASGVGGVPHVIQHGLSGMLTQGPDDIDGFVSALERLIQEPELREAIVLRARDYAETTHSWDNFLATLESEILSNLKGSSDEPFEKPKTSRQSG
jgi:glycosyltransferase involved in cell wall biosynthesis